MSGTRAAPTAGLDDALRRDFLSRLVALAIGAAGTGLHPARVLAQSLPNTAAHAVDARTQLVLLGTHGGPGVDPAQAQTASAVLVAGRPYLIDCGYGALRQMVAAHVPYLALGTCLLTHLHDDHTADLAALLSLQWTNGKSTATDVYGPYGTAALIEAALAYLRTNAQIRTIDEGRNIDPARLFHGHDVAATDAPVRMFADDRVTVQAVQNTHYPAHSIARMPYRSLALRLDSAQRSIVFAGDTAYSANVVRLARGADLFVCEIADAGVLAQMCERARAAAAAGHPDNIFRHVAETHSSPGDVARMASEAGVKSVVLNHQLPGPATPLAYPVTAFIDAVRQGYAGEVIVGQDLMVL
ncbi:MAG TPA: MBL fold metallo-hydrolase [Steroidobacteraceae bacterium]|nr:MBL fold metallo-hydrolase [Steroidobacteraceae bacterium]